MNEKILIASIEGVTILIKAILTLARNHGMGEEDLKLAYQRAAAEFDKKNPDKLPDV